MATILIADDAQIMRNILRLMLEKAGHEIVGNATNGVEALERYVQLKPELVTMDIHMEGGDGMTGLEQIVQQDPAAKVLMVSAVGQEQKEEEARNLGAVGYVRKPFQLDDLLEHIHNALTG
jgi:two-component system chemotaxis response regulator CheY